MRVRMTQVGPIATNCYILEDEESKKIAVIDPGDEAGRLQSLLKEMDGQVAYILLTHGHYYGVSMGAEGLADEAKSRGCDIAMYGHTHRPFLDRIDGVTVLNPGSLSYPRQEGRHPSYMIITVHEDGRIEYDQRYL